MGLVLNGFRLLSPDLWATVPPGVCSGIKQETQRGGGLSLKKFLRNQKYVYVKIWNQNLYRRNESRRKQTNKQTRGKDKTIGDWFVKTGGSFVRPM